MWVNFQFKKNEKKRLCQIAVGFAAGCRDKFLQDQNDVGYYTFYNFKGIRFQMVVKEFKPLKMQFNI